MRTGTTRLMTALAAGLLAAAPAAGQQALPDPPRADRQPAGPAAPRIAPRPEAEWTEEQRRLADRYAGDGRADNQLRTLLHAPAIVEGLMPVTVYLTEESTLPPRHRALLILRAAWLCGSRPLWATHAARAREGGMTDAEIRRVAEGPDAAGWDRFERTLLRLADQLYLNSSVTDAVWAALAERYDEHGLIDAVETVNHFTVLSMIYNAFGVQPDAETADRLPADVPYRVAVPAREPRLAAARIEPLDGPGIAVSRTFARHPALARPRSRRANYVNQVSPLSPRDREILNPPDRLGLPGGLRVGQARRHGRPRARSWGRPGGGGQRAGRPGRERVRRHAPPPGRRAVPGRSRLRRDVERPDRALRPGRDDERGLHAELVPGDVDVAQRVRRAARAGRRGIPRRAVAVSRGGSATA